MTAHTMMRGRVKSFEKRTREGDLTLQGTKYVNQVLYRIDVDCETWADMINVKFYEFLDKGHRQLKIFEE